ncbi:MAG: HAD-IA family hydrolase [Candidatus Freyrarchaeum guaymaensis]
MKIEKENEITAILFLTGIRGFGPVKFREIYEKFGSFASFLNLIVRSRKQMVDIGSLRKTLGKNVWFKLVQSLNGKQIEDYRRIAKKLLIKAEQINGKLITFHDEHYPQSLYRTNQCIPIIYALGNLGILKEENVSAVVGTRNPSEWTITQTRKLVKELVDESRIIVSGLAKGVDAIAHETALKNKGKTIAVMGCGPDVYYPPENRGLQNKIKHYGLIISEYPFGTRVTALSLKKRNKIIVGLSKDVYITETSVHGGTMNSYLAAIEQKKPIKIFLPISNVGGDFSGNLKIYCDQKVIVERIHPDREPSLSKLREIKLVLFDLDGTLWNSEEAFFVTIRSLLRDTKQRISEKKVKHIMKLSPTEILKSLNVPNSRFWKMYKKNYPNIRLFSEDTKNVILELIKSGKKVGIVTDLKEEIALELLNRFEIHSLISVIISPSQTRARKPSPIPILKAISYLKMKPHQAIYIGDRDVDILAAKNAGCFSGLAAWNTSVSLSENPDYVFADFNDLLLICR